MVSVYRYIEFASGSLVGRVLMVTPHALNGVSVCIYMLCMLSVPAAS